MTSVVLWMWMMCSVGAEPAPENVDAVREKQRQQAVAVMAPAKARLLNIHTGDGNSSAAVLRPEPLLRWSNSTVGSIYGEVFLWTRDDRPVAIASIYRWYHPFHDSTLEMVSLSESPLELHESQNLIWKCPGKGVELRSIAEGPAPATAKGMRLSQMRAIARQFAVELADDRGGEQVTRELRLLNQPVHRYASESHGITDGALFAFVEATDPEVILILEAVTAGEKSYWQYGLARMNAHGLKVAKNKVTVQTWVRVTDPAKDPDSPYAYFNFNPESIKIDKPANAVP